MKWLLCTVSLVALRAPAQTPANCSSPTYPCGLRQTAAQLTVIPLPSPLPALGGLMGAGLTWKDPVRGTTVLRCTDVNTYSGPNGFHGYEETESGGSSDIEWNQNGRLLTVILMNGGSNITVPFDPVALKCGPAIPGSRTLNGRVWSNRDPNTDYILVGTQVFPRTFNWENPQQAPVTGPLFFDWVTACPGLPPAAKITGPKTWHSPMWLTYDDSVFAIAFSDRGGQDTGEWLALYQPASNGCQVWNTLTGIITASGFGLSGAPSTFFSFTIHDIEMSYGGLLHVATGNTCVGCPARSSGFLFKAGGLTANLISTDVGGHNNVGYNTYANSINEVVFAIRNYLTPNIVSVVDPVHLSLPQPTATHVSWKQVDVLDSYGFMVGSQSRNQIVMTAPLENENFLVNLDGSFTRVSSTLNSGVPNPYNFRTANAIGSISKQGYYAWSSDDFGGFGNTDGVTPICTLGSAAPNACASHVLITIPGR